MLLREKSFSLQWNEGASQVGDPSMLVSLRRAQGIAGILPCAGRAQIQYSFTHRRLYAENFQVLSPGHHFNLPPGPASVSQEGRELPVLEGHSPAPGIILEWGLEAKQQEWIWRFERTKVWSVEGFPLRKRIHKYNTNLGMKMNIYLERGRKSLQSLGALGIQVPFFYHLFRWQLLDMFAGSWLFSLLRMFYDS